MEATATSRRHAMDDDEPASEEGAPTLGGGGGSSLEPSKVTVEGHEYKLDC